jgi:hypothetical protein
VVVVVVVVTIVVVVVDSEPALTILRVSPKVLFYAVFVRLGCSIYI